jgi:hypoxanthine phosphoribosyltransferase
VLKGSFIFLADLCRAMDCNIEIDFVRVSSYEKTVSSGKPLLEMTTSCSLRERDVVVVEDIVDTGRSIKMLTESLSLQEPASIRTVAMIDKSTRREVDVFVDFSLYQYSEKKFIVGYGLDYKQQYRNLSYLAQIE